jgi:hypothetical protein
LYIFLPENFKKLMIYKQSIYTSILEYPLTIKKLLMVTLPTAFISALTLIVYFQNKQLQDLLIHLTHQQDLLSQIQLNLSSLEMLLHEKNTEVILLKESIKSLSTTNSFMSLDSETIRAHTERRELYIKTGLAVLTTVAMLSAGLWFINGWSNVFTLKAWLPNSVVSFGKTFGFFTSVETYTKLHEGVYWKAVVIDSGADLQIYVKTPGLGEFGDAMTMLETYLRPGTVESLMVIPTQTLTSTLLTTTDAVSSVSPNAEPLSALAVVAADSLSLPVVSELINALPSFF